MKLAEALILRSDLQKRMEQLKQRLIRSAKVQDEEKPPEDPLALLHQTEEVAEELQTLIQRINRTNALARLGQGTVSDALAARDLLAKRRAVFADLAQAAVVQQDRYSKSEVRFRSTVDVSAMQRKADDLAKLCRELDTRLQEANWQVELME